jgi:3-deoxy-D-manno-octulosonic-acid transferase
VRLVYSVALGLLALGYLPVFLWRKVWRAGHPLAAAERLGFVPVRPGPDRIWVHAVSVGEVTAAVPLVRGLRARWPTTEVAISTVTATGAQVARARLPDVPAAFVLPIDLGSTTRRAVARVRPRCFIALETELWPNLIHSLAEAGIPVLVANGRISDRSFRRYVRVRRLFRRVLGEVTLFAMQSEEDARRVERLGAPPERVVVTGNLKYDAAPADDGATRRWRELLGVRAEDRVWVAGSTHVGEEGPVLDAFLALREALPALRVVLAPRHPERVPEVEALARARGLDPVRRTGLGARRAASVVLLDTVGELAGLYGVADVIFVGGSLVPAGGHNVIEPALHGKPIVFGPHMANFRDVAGLLLEAGGAVQLAGAAGLAPALRALLIDRATREDLGARAAAAVRAHQGACRRTVAAIEAALAGRPSRGNVQ